MKKLFLIASLSIHLCANASYIPFYLPAQQSISMPAKYAAASAAWASTAYLSGTVYYYCDCGTGASGACVAGNNSNAGTSSSAPRQTIEAASTFLHSSASAYDTVALCKGGAFNSTGGYLNPGSTRCTTGTTCNDLREYSSPVFTATAKPIINNAAGNIPLFMFEGNYGGLRILNIKLMGDNGALANRNRGFFFYSYAHDVTMGNLDMDGFDVSVYAETNAGMLTNLKFEGNYVINSRTMAYLGSGNGNTVNSNYFDGNGSSNDYDHTVYASAGVPVSHMSISDNYINGQYGAACLGSIITAHGAIDYFNVDRNEIVVTAAANSNGGCWGIDLNHGGYPSPVYFRHTSVSGNKITNGGNLPLSVNNCPGCLIENNLIITDWVNASDGIISGWEAHRTTPADDTNTGTIVRNNTVYYGPTFQNTYGSATGIKVKTEGANHIVSNNTVYYSSLSSHNNFFCYEFSLPLASYDFINNNHCYSAASFSWEVTNGATLAAWRTYSSGFDSLSLTGDPLFTTVGTDFTTQSGSPLRGAGNNTYKSILDITGKTRASPPDIGAYEH